MRILQMSPAKDPSLLARQAALDIAGSIQNVALRQYCVEQLHTSDTPEERLAAVALVSGLAQEDRRLRDNKSFAHRILDSTSDCVTVIDMQGNICS